MFCTTIQLSLISGCWVEYSIKPYKISFGGICN